MKIRALLLIISTLFFSNYFVGHISAQTPQGISYQIVARNVEGMLVTNQGVGIQVSIIKNSYDGDAVYIETHSPETNINALVSIEIGGGNTVYGAFSSIDWSNGPYFVKTEIDPTSEGGTNYSITSISQMLTVPYAFHAKTAESIVGGITEIDPVFSAWDKSTGITVNESQINDLGTYLEIETDPLFAAWDKSTGINITENQISDFGSYIEDETDPVFSAWNKSTGITITESQISNLGNYLTSETDPVFNQSVAKNITNAGSGSVITSAERNKLSGIEAGAQQNVKADWNASSGDAEILNKPANLSAFTNDTGYISLAETPVAGDMLFYNGEGWGKLAKGTPGQVLSVSSEGELVWGKLAAVPDAITLDPTIQISGIAILNGTVSANGLATTITFEYGTTTSYGNSVIADQSPLSGNATVVVTTTVNGLTLGETYHFRVKAENILGTVYGEDKSFVALKVGDAYQGGKVAYIFQPEDHDYVEGETHGLIASTADLSTGIKWNNGSNILVGADGTGIGDGDKNTFVIIDIQGDGDYAAILCDNYSVEGYSDWYLPSTGELLKLHQNRGLIGGFDTWSSYWSSTEVDADNVKVLRFNDGSWWTLLKNVDERVRAVRMF